jgi:hypothetical protein
MDDIGPTRSTFEVLGDISVSSEELAVSGIDTPFGSMSQSFNFKTKELIGTLIINKQITLGSVVVYNATISTCFGGEGFYIIGGCKAFLPAGIFAGIYNTGLMLGSHLLTPEMWKLTNSYIDDKVVNWCYKADHERLSGFYFAFNRELFSARKEFNFGVANGYIDALGLIGGNTYVNVIGGNLEVGLGGYVHVHAGAGLAAITGTSLKGDAYGEGKILFVLGSPTFIDATIGLGFNATIIQDFGLEKISKSIHVDAMAKGGTSGFSFSLQSSDSELNSCK